MHPHSRMLPYPLCNSFFFCNLLLITNLPQSLSREDDHRYITCSRPYNCGNKVISYPFWGGNRPHYCGGDGFEVTCLSPDITPIQIGSQNFTLIELDSSRSIVKMVRTDIQNYDNCCFPFTNTSLDSALFSLSPTVVNMTIFYNCVPGFSMSRNTIVCRDDREKRAFFFDQSLSTQCPEFPVHQHCGVQLQVPVTWGVTADPFGDIESLKAGLDEGFDVVYIADEGDCINAWNLEELVG